MSLGFGRGILYVMRAKSIPAADNHIADGDKALLKMTTVLPSGTYTLFGETRIIPERILTSGIPHSGQNTRARGNFLLTSLPRFFFFSQSSSPVHFCSTLPRFCFSNVLPHFVFPMFFPGLFWSWFFPGSFSPMFCTD